MIRTAILMDGGFVLKRLSKVYPTLDMSDPVVVADTIYKMASSHIDSENENRKGDEPISFLYRIFFYDCPPFNKKVHYPISKKSLDFSKSDQAIFRTALHEALRHKRKVALRLGQLADNLEGWVIKPNALKELLKGEKQIQQLQDADFTYPIRQKGVDMKIGLDISSLALKKQIEKIILVAGDADFVPSAKMARREGIDFILDPMCSAIHPDLNEHIDGLKSICAPPSNK